LGSLTWFLSFFLTIKKPKEERRKKQGQETEIQEMKEKIFIKIESGLLNGWL